MNTFSNSSGSKTLFVGNLHASLEETDLLDIFKQYGRIIECCKRWCHYGFIQFGTEEEAKQAYISLNGSKVRGRPMRIEFQRKKVRNLQALFEAESDIENNNNKPLFHSFQQNEQLSNYDNNETLIYEKNIEKFFDDLMSDQQQQQQQQQQTRPLGNLDINTTILKRFRPCLTQDKENINIIHDNLATQNNKTSHLSSNCSSPISFKDNSPRSFQTKTNVMLFRSINNSHKICVEPTDVLEPLNEGDFAEYKLFPQSFQEIKFNKKNDQTINSSLKSVLQGLEMNHHHHQSSNDEIMHILTDYTPQSLSLSCSSASSLPSSLANSPITFYSLL